MKNSFYSIAKQLYSLGYRSTDIKEFENSGWGAMAILLICKALHQIERKEKREQS